MREYVFIDRPPFKEPWRSQFFAVLLHNGSPVFRMPKKTDFARIGIECKPYNLKWAIFDHVKDVVIIEEGDRFKLHENGDVSLIRFN